MNTMKTYLLISAILLSAVTFVTAATNDLTTAIQRGLFEEEANQNLGAAIQAYQSVANQFDKDRKLAATAIFRLGECYRKQGNTNDAATHYERILREFSDQPTLVTLSRQNLAALGSAPPAVAAPVLSDAARQEQKRLLEEEIKLVQKQLEAQQKQLQVGATGPDALWPTEREILKLKRQIAALDAGLPVSVPATETTSPAASTEADEVRRIQSLIKDSPDLINAPDRKGETLLQSAAAKGKLAIVKLLLDSGAAVDGLQQPGLTALHYAAANGHKAVVDLLLSKGAKAGAQTENGVTPLHLAARKGYESVVKALLAAGAPVNAAPKELGTSDTEDLQYRVSGGQTPLHLAASAGYAGLVELLLAKGPDVNAVDAFGRTPLSYAVDKHYQPVVQLLLAAHANPNAGASNLPLTEAAYYGDMPALKLLLANGADPNINTNVTAGFGQIHGLNPTSGGNATPLAAAVSQKHADAVAELIRAKADPNGSTADGYPLIVSAMGDAPMLKALLEGGADPNRPDLGGMPPLMYAVTQGPQPAVELLLAYKADPNIGRPQYGWTPLLEAAQRDSKGIAEVLLKAGADVNAKADDGWTPLHMAVSRKQREVAELLLANHANPNAKMKDGQTPLHFAVQSGQRELAELLLANKADPNERNKSGQTPLDLAKSMAQHPQLMPGMLPPPAGTAVPMRLPGAAPGYPGQPPSVASTAPVQEAKPETVADLLRRHGALDDLPHLDQIGVRRTATGASCVILIKGAQDWNRFTLLDLFAVQYDILASQPDAREGDSYSLSAFTSQLSRLSSLPFPDVAHLRISRPAADLKSWQDQVVDLRPVLESGDCAKDMRLRWGDIVEIPEADHPLNERWEGFSKTELTNLKKCLTRKVEIVVKGQATTITLAPGITGLEEGNEGEMTVIPKIGGDPQSLRYGPTVTAHTSFWLRPVLLQSKLVLISSELSRVKVTRRDPGTGQTREWVVDCSKGGDSAPNLWLQDGDRIEVPEKTSASTSQAEQPQAEAPGMAPPPPALVGPVPQPAVRPPAGALRVPAAGVPQTAVPLQYQWQTDQPREAPPAVSPQAAPPEMTPPSSRAAD
jgi:ankyrin repeat protein